ncbi:hypothetical protein, partial [Lactobacillus mulieris]|uniref:hypothetical protein n=1 Tax=Lactobacillus mulieris TaxID=2508708 RepID=UPI001F097243
KNNLRERSIYTKNLTVSKASFYKEYIVCKKGKALNVIKIFLQNKKADISTFCKKRRISAFNYLPFFIL